MEIRIKTHEELRADRVTIEITGTGAEVTEFAETRLPSRNLYTDEEVANLQASEAELVASPLRRRIAELERMLASAIDREARLEIKVQGYDRDRHDERDRADKAEKELAKSRELVQEERTRGNNLAERLAKAESKLMAGHVCTGGCSENQHVAFVGRKALTEMENQVAELTRRIDNARVILSDPQLEDARKSIVTRNTIALDKAIGKALDTLA